MTIDQYNNRTIKDNGFTIIEALVAIFVLTVGIVGCMTLANQVLRTSEISKDRLIAVNLAQEGIEVIRNIRDTNWLVGTGNWNDNIISDCNGSSLNKQVAYNSTSTEAYADSYLKLDSNGYYNYTSGNDTTFKRKLTVQCLEFPEAGQYKKMLVEARVYWTSRGTSKEILMTEHLYDWK